LPDLWELVNGFRVSQALYVAATLGLADRVAAEPRSADELAREAGADPDTLYRLLRALASVGVFHEDEDRRFSLTELGEDLRSDSPTSIAGWVAFIGREHIWHAWGELLHSVRTGENAFRHLHGTDVWSYRQEHEEDGRIFDRAMSDLTRHTHQAILDAYDFGRFGTVVDVAGGRGALLVSLLEAYPNLQGVLFDQPAVVSAALAHERLRVESGSFFESVPEGSDAYILKWIIHDWGDEESIAILRTCRAAMRDDSVLLLLERIVEEPNRGSATKFSDLNMLVMPGGRERTVDEFAQLFSAAGLRLSDVSGGNPIAVIEALPAED
jgi:O-methyltransferase/methyltransferase family protein